MSVNGKLTNRKMTEQQKNVLNGLAMYRRVKLTAEYVRTRSLPLLPAYFKGGKKKIEPLDHLAFA